MVYMNLFHVYDIIEHVCVVANQGCHVRQLLHTLLIDFTYFHAGIYLLIVASRREPLPILVAVREVADNVQSVQDIHFVLGREHLFENAVKEEVLDDLFALR